MAKWEVKVWEPHYYLEHGSTHDFKNFITFLAVVTITALSKWRWNHLSTIRLLALEYEQLAHLMSSILVQNQ